MNIKRIDSYIGIASKLSTGKPFDYYIWEKENGSLYVQFSRNRSRGKFSKFLFSVTEYQDQRKDFAAIGQLRGYDIERKKFRSADNNNNGAFLKAVLRHLFADHDGGKSALIKNGKFNHEAVADNEAAA